MKNCKIWKGAKMDAGYGVLGINGKTILAHRLSLMLKLGRNIKPGMGALHRCNNPSCINPDHLYEGTAAENLQDAKKAGTLFNLGGFQVHNQSKLTIEQAIRIKKRLKVGDQAKEIAKDEGVRYALIWRIKSGKTWAHLHI
jgi:hypothetical protein